MISLINKNNKLDENKNSINVTYPRSVNILFGNYPYPEIVHNFILDIKSNLDTDMENYTNVRGGMTNWNYFLEKHEVTNAWGNEIKPGDSLHYHTHPCRHGILYLTEGCDLELPELNIKITPKPGDYYIFPPEILHGFQSYGGKDNRYSLIFNIEQGDKLFKFNKNIEQKNS